MLNLIENIVFFMFFMIAGFIFGNAAYIILYIPEISVVVIFAIGIFGFLVFSADIILLYLVKKQQVSLI